MYLPMSTGLAGKMYSSDGIQPFVGFNCKLNGVLGTRIHVYRTAPHILDIMGMISIYRLTRRDVYAMSDTTLCTENSDPDLKVIGFVRANDWLHKSITNYLNELTFQTFDGKIRYKIKRALFSFFNKINGPGKLLETYSIDKIDRDQVDPYRINVSIRIKPYFATKYYVVDYSSTQSKFESKEQD